MDFSDIAPNTQLEGVEPTQRVSVVATAPAGANALQLIYRTADGVLKDRLITTDDLASIRVATSALPFTFDGDADTFRLVCEAKRMDLAFLFDPLMAVHTANMEPLPHQITAVYGDMLPRTPLRFVLADDPGAGKTIMAGLYIRELLLRADARRILIVAPGSLVDQWRDELFEKFGLEFRVYSTLLEQQSASGNAFDDHPQLIARLDQLSRNEELQAKLCDPGWDLVVFDEAHKLAAHFYGQKIEKTARYRLAETIGAHTRHLLLMTATPHNGREEDFQLFLALLDSDRFYGKFRDGVHKVDPSDLMRRMVKEDLVKFDGTPLFPERRAYTVNYVLSHQESALYEAVTDYVKTEMGKADLLTGSRKGSVGFALTTLQRRLASSPEAIYQSLQKRHERLSRRLAEERQGLRARQWQAQNGTPDIPEDDDDLSAEEQEALEENLVDDATAARSVHELEVELRILERLVRQAQAVVASGQDRKWDELSKLLQHDTAMLDATGNRRKLIIFSEHRATLDYLQRRIAGVLGNDAAVITIHGGTGRDERRRLQAEFRVNSDVLVLVATDAAGEGVNLQNANLMVNYDLPWNPNRLEQRFGRIHRIGQTEVCHLWNLVAAETREGEVYHRLLKKLEVENVALKGRVFDILGEVFQERSLKDLLMDAIRYGDDPKRREYLTTVVDEALDHQHLQELLNRNALAQETLTPDRLFAVKEEMEKAAARRLQPHFVRAYFAQAFRGLGGIYHPREANRFEITHVPVTLRERDRLLTGRNRRQQEPVLKRYSRIAFDRHAIQPLDRPGLPRADLMHPGHPLMLAVTDVILDQHTDLLRQGATLIDPADPGRDPWLLLLLTHEVKSAAADRAGEDTVLSKRIQFVRLDPDGEIRFAGWAPHLDLEAPQDLDDPALLAVLDDLRAAPWLNHDAEASAIAYAAAELAPAHHREVADRRIAHVDKTLAEVHARLTAEINYWTDRWVKLKEDSAAGKDLRINIENAARTIAELGARLESRKRELQAMRHVVSGAPRVLGAALVIPAGLLAAQRGHAPLASSADAQARARIEQIAMHAVRADYESRGYTVVDVAADKCGWDLTAYPPAQPGRSPDPLHIEVKGRAADADTITVTRNEILYALNQAQQFRLAIVRVHSDDSIDGPHYLTNPFHRAPDDSAAAVVYNLADLLHLGD